MVPEPLENNDKDHIIQLHTTIGVIVATCFFDLIL